MIIPFDTLTAPLFVTEDRDTTCVSDPKLCTQRRIRRAGRRGAHDGEDVVVAGERRHVPGARSEDILTPRTRLGVNHAEDGGTRVVGRRDVELPVTGVVPNLVSAVDLRD